MLNANRESGSPILDRVLWLAGVRTMLGADASYLVLRSFNEEAADFARGLGVDVMTMKQLERWETAIKIPKDGWPNRSDFRIFDPIKKESRDRGRQKEASETEKIVRLAIQFIEIDSWHIFGYRHLNTLFRILKELSDAPDKSVNENVRRINANYVASALLVRLCQYLLAVCHDVSRVPLTDLKSYLFSRLVFGDQNPQRARGLVESTVSWVSHALNERGAVIPIELDTRRLFDPPSFAEGLVGLTEKLLVAPNEARYLPFAMETEQFSKEEDLEQFPRLRATWKAGSDLVALVKAFAVASLGVDASLLAPFRSTHHAPTKDGREGTMFDVEHPSSQPNLKIGDV